MDAIKLVIFDIAGTIIEDHGEVVSAFAGALDKHRIPYTDDELKEWKGSSKEEVIRHFVERQGGGAVLESAVGIVYADFRIALERHYREKGVVPIVGAADTGRVAKGARDSDRHDVGVLSRSFGIDSGVDWVTAGMLAASISSSDVPAGRPAPYMIFRAMEAASVTSVREVVNVGDTPRPSAGGDEWRNREWSACSRDCTGKSVCKRSPIRPCSRAWGICRPGWRNNIRSSLRRTLRRNVRILKRSNRNVSLRSSARSLLILRLPQQHDLMLGFALGLGIVDRGAGEWVLGGLKHQRRIADP